MIPVVISDPLSPEGRGLLEASGLFELRDVNGADAVALAAALTDARALLIRSGTRVTAPVLAVAPRLELVGRAGTGVDNVDVTAATERGVVVMNTPDANSVAAAELTLALLLALVRNVPAGASSLAAGRWERSGLLGTELAGKTLGLVGCGRIGREVVRRALAFDMTVLVSDPLVDAAQAAAFGGRAVPFDELLATADVVSLHAPLTPSTRHLLDEAALARMKPGARLVNVARGGLVDEAALARALDDGRIGGAAFDVFETEPPPPGHPLVGRKDVVATPHLGASTREAQDNVSRDLAKQVIDYFANGIVRNAVNRGPG
jgi:D-3-phosphoglycerate dehydrogenase